MIYIGFSTRSHKISAHILCRHFRHCAPVLLCDNKYILYQFSNMRNIHSIILSERDLKILEKYGWQFIKIHKKANLHCALETKSLTCVQFTKKFCGINNIKIQTPDALFKYIK